MKVIPAIDILSGKCVRLTQGDFRKVKIYNDDPLEVALQFQDAGLKYLHLVDLDGAKQGKVTNWHVIEEIQKNSKLIIDFGGGIKTEEEVKRLFDLGIRQINIGSLAIQQPLKFILWINKFGPDKFILSADVKNETVVVNGWGETTEVNLFNLVGEFVQCGLEYLACTDIAMDGMLNGSNLDLYKKLKSSFPKLSITASGGITTIEDLRKLESLSVEAAIVGKALYEQKIKLQDLKSF